MRLQQTEGEKADAGPKLTSEELTEVLNTAIARQGEAERLRDQQARQAQNLSTLDDAVEIARSLNIPEEHVLAAAADLNRAKLRPARREAVGAKRRAGFRLAAIVLGLITLFSAIFVGPLQLSLMVWLWIIGLPLWLPVLLITLYLGFRAFAPVGDAEADAFELPAPPGQCRVCGAPAHNERATFCEQHRYRGPG